VRQNCDAVDVEMTFLFPSIAVRQLASLSLYSFPSPASKNIHFALIIAVRFASDVMLTTSDLASSTNHHRLGLSALELNNNCSEVPPNKVIDFLVASKEHTLQLFFYLVRSFSLLDCQT
jgi:hypothetical protein